MKTLHSLATDNTPYLVKQGSVFFIFHGKLLSAPLNADGASFHTDELSECYDTGPRDSSMRQAEIDAMILALTPVDV